MEISQLSQHGLCLIPVHPKTKHPKWRKWQQRTAQDNNLKEFAEDTNVGVVLGKASGNVVDIDLDSEITRKSAPYFLPPTGWVFGRKSEPRSHWIYRVVGEAGRVVAFKAYGKKVVEYRADGGFSVFPPSVHESGEVVEFDEFSEIGVSTRAELLEAAGCIAALALLAPKYVRSQRNDIILALAGTLLRGGKSESDVVYFVEALCGVTDDEEKQKRVEAVHSTQNRIVANQPYTQRGHLAELIGREITEDLCRYLGLKWHEVGQEPASSSQVAALAADEMNDTGVAMQFAAHAKDRLLFIDELSCFYVYEDGIWMPDGHELAVAAKFDKFIEQRINELRSNSQQVPHDQCASQVKFLLKYRNRINVCNAIMQSRSYLCATRSQLDQGDALVAVRNGLLRLTDSTLLPFSPQHYVTKRLDVVYDPTANCPTFKRLLRDSFDNDEVLIRYVQGILGYCLTGRIDRQEVYVFHGCGNNGKSTLVNAVKNVLGPLAGTLMSETIFEGMGGQHASDLASMIGKRLAVVHEAESRFKLNAPRIKQLTGGDSIKVKALYKDPIEIIPKFKIVIICNKRPYLDAYDEALKRRLKLLSFEHVVPPNKRDIKLGDKLEAEAPGILNFLIEGAAMYFRDEFREPQAVKVATKSYIADQDSVTSFLQDCTRNESGATVGKGMLYGGYLAYCSEECLDAVSKRDFGKILIKMGYQDTRGATERKWRGLRLSSSDEGFEESIRGFAA